MREASISITELSLTPSVPHIPHTALHPHFPNISKVSLKSTLKKFTQICIYIALSNNNLYNQPLDAKESVEHLPKPQHLNSEFDITVDLGKHAIVIFIFCIWSSHKTYTFRNND